MTRLAGRDLIVLLFSAILLWHSGRAAFPEGRPPAFLVDDEPEIFVWLGEGFRPVGVRQFSDEALLRDVMELTEQPLLAFSCSVESLQVPVLSGQSCRVERGEGGPELVCSGVMSAARRMALGIPLHPDRMKRDDWLELKGVGPVLADRIEKDRQENGDFGGLNRLQRVKGIGPKRIESWKRFF